MSKKEKEVEVKEETDVTTEENTDKIVDKIEENANNIEEDTKEVSEDTTASADTVETEEAVESNKTVEKEEDPHKAIKEELKAEITKELKKELNGSNYEEDEEVIEPGFFGNLSVSFVDLVVSAGIAFALYMLTKVILKLIGYNIVDTFGIYLIVYVITNLFYRPVCQSTKMKETVGEKLLNRK